MSLRFLETFTWLFQEYLRPAVAGNRNCGEPNLALQRLRALFDASPDMILLHTPDGRIVDMNAKALRVYGYGHEDIASLTVEKLSGHGCRGGHADELVARVLRGEALDFDWTAMRRDGSEFPVEVRLRRVEGDPDMPKGGVVAVVRDLSVQNQVEDTLQRTVGLFESAFKHAAIGMAVIATDGRWLKVNDAICRITGYPEVELLQLDFQSITHPDDLDADLAFFRQLLAGQIETYQMEKRYLHKDGKAIWVLLSVSLVRDAQLKPLFFISQIQDISARKQAKLQLQLQRDFSEAIINTIGSVVVVLDREGRIAEFNRAAQKLTGYCAEEVLGKFFWDFLLPPEQLEGVRGEFSRLTTGDYPSRYENHWITREGERRLLAWSNTVLQDDSGEVLYIIATGIDVTEQRIAEQQLRDSEERFRFVAQSASDLIVEWHTSGDTLNWFGDIDSALGYQPGEFPRTSKAWFAQIHPEDQPRIEAAINRHWESGEPLCTEYRIRALDGSWRTWEDRGTGIIDEQGHRTRFIGAVTDITERKAAETAISRLGRLMQQSVSEIYVFRADTMHFVEISQGARENLGYSEDEFKAMTPMDLKPGFTNETFMQLIAPLQRGDTETLKFRTVHRRKNGSEYPAAVQLQLSRQETPPVYLAVIEDITNQQSAEAGRLRLLERLGTLKQLDRAILTARSVKNISRTALRYIRELIPAFRAEVCVFNHPQGTIRIIDVSGYSTAGIDADDELPTMDAIVGNMKALGEGKVQRIDDLRTLAAPPMWCRHFVDQGVRSIMNVPLIVRDCLFGSIDLLSTEVAAYDDEHVEIAHEVATSVAIAFQQAGLNEEIKSHVEELEQRVQARTQELSSANESLTEEINIRISTESVLRDREQRFRRFYELGLIGMAVVSLDKHWGDFNERLCEILGYDKGELQQLTWAEISHPDDLQADLEQYNRVLKGEMEGYSLDKRFVCKNGSIVYTSVSTRCVRKADSTIDYFVKFVQDITERKLAEEILQRSNEELAEANRDLESFSYSVSHDLRSPLRAIDGFSMMLLEDYGDQLDDTGRSYFERIRTAAQTMGRLIDDLLKLGRVARQPLTLKPLDMSVMCQSILVELQERDATRAVTWRVCEGLKVKADAELFRAVLVNILGNAWKYTAENATAEIEVGQAGMGSDRYFYIKDNGVGFDMQYADKIFLPFHRLHKKDRFDGTGIGLATVARIINRHNGRIWADSAPGVGTEIRFSLRQIPGKG